MESKDCFINADLLDEAPRFWLSRRWRLAVLSCIGFLIVTSNRLGVEVALLCMFNKTNSDVITGQPITARFPAQIGLKEKHFELIYTASDEQMTKNETHFGDGDEGAGDDDDGDGGGDYSDDYTNGDVYHNSTKSRRDVERKVSEAGENLATTSLTSIGLPTSATNVFNNNQSTTMKKHKTTNNLLKTNVTTIAMPSPSPSSFSSSMTTSSTTTSLSSFSSSLASSQALSRPSSSATPSSAPSSSASLPPVATTFGYEERKSEASHYRTTGSELAQNSTTTTPLLFSNLSSPSPPSSSSSSSSPPSSSSSSSSSSSTRFTRASPLHPTSPSSSSSSTISTTFLSPSLTITSSSTTSSKSPKTLSTSSSSMLSSSSSSSSLVAPTTHSSSPSLSSSTSQTPQSSSSSSYNCRPWNTTTHSILFEELLNVSKAGDLSWTTKEFTAIWEAYYLGDLISKIPSALLVQRFGGKKLFTLSILVESICTALTPLAAKVHYFPVLLLRLVSGLSAGLSTPAMFYMMGRWSPPDERCLLMAIVNTGGWMSSSVVIIPVSCLLCSHGFAGGWASVFYVYGGLGMFWCVLWMLFSSDTPDLDSGIKEEEKKYINASIRLAETIGARKTQGVPKPKSSSAAKTKTTATTTFGISPSKTTSFLFNRTKRTTTKVREDNEIDILSNVNINNIIKNNSNFNINIDNNDNKNQGYLFKWQTALTSLQLFVLCCNEFTHEWLFYTYVVVLPVYAKLMLNYPIFEYTISSILPYAGFWFAMMMTSGAADRLHSYGVLPVTHIRKIMNSIGSLISSSLLLSFLLFRCNQRQGLMYTAIIGTSFNAFYHCGSLLAPFDLASKYASVLVGVSGMVRASVRFLVPIFAGLLLKRDDEGNGLFDRTQWCLLFVVTSVSHISSALLYLFCGTGDHQARWFHAYSGSSQIMLRHYSNDAISSNEDETTGRESKMFSENATSLLPKPKSGIKAVEITAEGNKVNEVINLNKQINLTAADVATRATLASKHSDHPQSSPSFLTTTKPTTLKNKSPQYPRHQQLRYQQHQHQQYHQPPPLQLPTPTTFPKRWTQVDSEITMSSSRDGTSEDLYSEDHSLISTNTSVECDTSFHFDVADKLSNIHSCGDFQMNRTNKLQDTSEDVREDAVGKEKRENSENKNLKSGKGKIGKLAGRHSISSSTPTSARNWLEKVRGGFSQINLKRASFVLDSSSDNRNDDDDDGDDVDNDDVASYDNSVVCNDDDEEEGSSTSNASFVKRIDKTLFIDSDLSESVV